MNRRTFVQKTSTLGMAAMALPLFSCNSGKKVSKMGVQLYTVRDDMDKNPEKTLARIAEIGFVELECHGYKNGILYGKKIPELAQILKQLGINMISSHIGTGTKEPTKIGTLSNGFEMAVADAAALGQKFLVCPNLNEKDKKTIDGF